MSGTIQISEDDIRQLLGMIEGLTLRLEQIERLLSLRLKTKLMVVGKDDRGAAELLAGIREGVQIETILLDIGGRLHDLEYHCFAPAADKAVVEQLLAAGSEEQRDVPEAAGDNLTTDSESDAPSSLDEEVPGDGSASTEGGENTADTEGEPSL